MVEEQSYGPKSKSDAESSHLNLSRQQQLEATTQTINGKEPNSPASHEDWAGSWKLFRYKMLLH